MTIQSLFLGKIRAYVCSIVFLMLPSSIFAQYYKDEIVQEAHSLRTDISPEVLAKIEGWKSMPIFHGNWIQNRDGKSLWLDGTEVLPDVEYKNLKEYYPGVFEVSVEKEGSNYDYLRGLYRNDGTQLTPTKYKNIHYSDVYGFIKATDYSVPDGKMYNHSCDLYTLQGELITTIKFQNPEKFNNSVNVNYEKDANLLIVCYYPKKGVKTKTYQLFYPDGQLAYGPYETKGYISTYNLKKGILEDGKKELSIPDFNPSAHPRIEHEWGASQEFISEDFKNNYWIRRASECFENEEWEETLRFLKIYNELDRHIYIRNCPEALTYSIMWLRSNHALGNFKFIYDQVVNNNMMWYNLAYNKKKKELYTTLTWGDKSERTNESFKTCNEIFNEAVAVVTAEENEIRRQRNAELWAVALKSLSGTVNQILSSSLTSSSSSSSRKPVSTKNTSRQKGQLNIDKSSVGGVKARDLPHSSSSDEESSSSSSSHSSSGSSGSMCKQCVGRGYCKTCTGTGVMTGYTLKDKIKCSTCDGSGKCPFCKGTGRR